MIARMLFQYGGVRTSVLFVIAWLLLVFGAPQGGAEGGESYANAGLVDVHMHLDGVQSQERRRSPQQNREKFTRPRRRAMMDRQYRTQNRRPPPPLPRKRAMMDRQGARSDGTASADYLVEMMDKFGVEKAIVMPPPQNPKQRGAYQYTALLNSIRKYPDRLILGAGGGSLNPMIQGTKPSEVTEEIRDAFKAKAKEIVRAGAHVFAEMAALHTCMNPRHHYVAAPPDHPLFLLLADLAAQYDLPIDLHMEAVQEDMPTPEHLLQACDKNPNILPATIPAFERLLDHNPKARIVWQHIGWDNTGEMTPSLLRRLLEKHSNLYLAIKAVPGPTRRNRIHNDTYKVLPEWLELFKSFSDRIVVGADEFARSPNVQGGYRKPPFFENTWRVVMSMPVELRKQIGKENPRRIYNLK